MRGLVLVLFFAVVVYGETTYLMSEQGESCAYACHKRQLNCHPHIETNNSAALFHQLGISCTEDTREWWAEDQPSYVSDPSDANYGRCLGYTSVPGGVVCGVSYSTVKRLCRCEAPSASETTFGFGYSNGVLHAKEWIVFQHWLAAGDYGVMTHFWMTIPSNVESNMIVRYYIDGEATASVEYQPGLACGVGYNDNQAPWGTQWVGKGAADGSWFNNIMIPFQRSIVVTVQHTVSDQGGFYVIVRGQTNLPIHFGSLTLPSTTKLTLVKWEGTLSSMEYVDFVNIKSGAGMVFFHTLQVDSGNLNFLEGCYHMFTNDEDWPGTVLSTGTEDYYDSGWYFNAGEFHLPVAGYTHYAESGGRIYFSAYRFHEMDPLMFSNGMRFVWRNGDTYDAAGVKCMMEEGGIWAGSPTSSNVVSYSWVYTW
ncbi:DUF2961 domain-containing protein [Pelomyxa schiedti]|nr:DUF2961 domain-containing protein [Pelomyxa schiedti]